MNLSDESPGRLNSQISCRLLPRSQLLLQGVADGGRRRRLCRLVLLDFLALLLPHGRAVAQADASGFRADLDDLEVVFLAGFERARAFERTGRWPEAAGTFVAAAPVFDLRVVAEAF